MTKKHTVSTRALVASLALGTSIALAAGSTVAVAAPDDAQQTKQFRKAVKAKNIGRHLDVLQSIADAAGGTRASGTPGYDASRNYVVRRLRDAGYRPQIQSFTFPFFVENTPAALAQVSPDATTYTEPADFSTMTFSGSGDVEAEVVAVDTDLVAEARTSGCETEDFSNFPEGAIALMQRGSCAFGLKTSNAEEAGAAAAIIFNSGLEGATDSFAGTLGAPADIPSLGTSFAVGQDLGDPSGTTAQVSTDTTNEDRTTYNVTAETRKGNPDNIVMVGAHLDSVEGGAGINDNGSGSATILETAIQLNKKKFRKNIKNQVRFAWWGAEELGLLGSYEYVDDLAANNPWALRDIAMYLNFDMVGSPNYARFVYDGDNSLGTGVDGPEGSAQLEKLFARYFRGQGLRSEPTEFSGRSDYAAFLEQGIPSGGLFTGAEGVMNARQARWYDGTAGVAYDECYHAECDDRRNVNMDAINEMGDAVAHSVYTLARSTETVNGRSNGSTKQGAKVARKGLTADPHDGNAMTR